MFFFDGRNVHTVCGVTVSRVVGAVYAYEFLFIYQSNEKWSAEGSGGVHE